MVSGHPRLALRLEGAAVLAAAAFLYGRYGQSWILFAVLFFAPDLSMVGYLAGPRIGAYAYNVVHVYVGPAALVMIGLVGERPRLYAIGLIWLAHIGFDRAVGYGLKYPSGFKDTHLGTIGR